MPTPLAGDRPAPEDGAAGAGGGGAAAGPPAAAARALLSDRDILGLILPFLGPEELLVAERVSVAWRAVTLATDRWLFLAGSTRVKVKFQRCIRTGMRVNCVAHHPAASLLLCGLHNGWVQLYDSRTGDVVCEIEADPVGNGGVRTVCFAAEQACAAGTEGGSLAWWSLLPTPGDNNNWVLRPQHQWRAHEGAVLCSCVHGAAAYLFSGGEDHVIRGWDVHLNATLLREFRGHSGPVTALVPHPLQAAVISGSTDQSTCVWDIAHLTGVAQAPTTEVVAKAHLSHSAPVRAISAKPGRDGTWDLFVSLPDSRCLVWCMQDSGGQRLTAEFRHSGGANAAVLTDGFWVTAGEDCKMRFWHPLGHHSLGSHRLLHGPIFSLSVSKAEIAAGCSQGLLMGDIVLKRTQSDVSEAKKRLFKHRRPREGPA